MNDLKKIFLDSDIETFHDYFLSAKVVENIKECKSFFNMFFTNSNRNPNKKIDEFLNLLINKENPFQDTSDVEYFNILYYNKLRYLYFSKERNDEEYLELLSKISKESIIYVNALILVGTHYTKFSYLGKAFKTYNKARELLLNFEDSYNTHKEKVMIYANLAHVYNSAELFEKAEEYFIKAEGYLLKDNLNAKLVAKLNVAKSRFFSGKFDSVRYLQELDKIKEDNIYDYEHINKTIILNESECYLKNKKFQKAYDLLLDFQKKTPLNELLLINLLISLYSLEKFDEFEILFKDKIEILIRHPVFHPRNKILDKAIELSVRKKDKKMENECLYLKIKFDTLFYDSSKLFLLEMAQVEHELKINERKLEHEKIKAKDQLEFTNTLLNKNKELEQFASIVAHDIKSPLRSVVNLLGILEVSLELDEDELEIFNTIKDSNKKLDRFVDDLVNYAKYGKSVEKYQYIDLNESFNEVKTLLMKSIPEDNVSINIKTHLPSLYAYESACTQLFLNLINNSIKFKKPNKNAIIDVWHENKYNKVYIYIKDNGVGIKKEDLNSIFKPFKRGYTSTETEGIGIGLATCQKIIDNINAKISVESVLDNGATFIIEINQKLTKV